MDESKQCMFSANNLPQSWKACQWHLWHFSWLGCARRHKEHYESSWHKTIIHVCPTQSLVSTTAGMSCFSCTRAAPSYAPKFNPQGCFWLSGQIWSYLHLTDKFTKYLDSMQYNKVYWSWHISKSCNRKDEPGSSGYLLIRSLVRLCKLCKEVTNSHPPVQSAIHTDTADI